jgi:hypothetical protein
MYTLMVENLCEHIDGYICVAIEAHDDCNEAVTFSLPNDLFFDNVNRGPTSSIFITVPSSERMISSPSPLLLPIACGVTSMATDSFVDSLPAMRSREN